MRRRRPACGGLRCGCSPARGAAQRAAPGLGRLGGRRFAGAGRGDALGPAAMRVEDQRRIGAGAIEQGEVAGVQLGEIRVQRQRFATGGERLLAAPAAFQCEHMDMHEGCEAGLECERAQYEFQRAVAAVGPAIRLGRIGERLRLVAGQGEHALEALDRERIVAEVERGDAEQLPRFDHAGFVLEHLLADPRRARVLMQLQQPDRLLYRRRRSVAGGARRAPAQQAREQSLQHAGPRSMDRVHHLRQASR